MRSHLMELHLPLISASLGAMRSLAEKLDASMDTELKDEIGKLRSRQQDLAKIRDPPLTARRWMKDVRELSYEMENCVDTETDWFLKISRFKARVKDFNGRYDRYALKEVLSHTKNIDPIVGRRLPTVGSDREPDLLVGLHGEGGAVDKLCHLLTDGDEHLKVLTIVGVGGIGKTTLAKELWRKHKPGDHFDCRAFVRTAKKPDMRRVLRSILAQVRPDQPPDANEVHDLIHDLNEHLQNKRYFIIIEDVWATSVWDIARHAFPKGHHSRIVRTTEVAKVALACRSYPSSYIFQMKPLSDSHAKELFTNAVFQSGEQYSPQLEGIIDEVVRICAGLPQAIISISSVLASQGDTIENWEQIQNSLPTTSDEILKQVITFCYGCLPSCLQTCLLYLSLYPENYIILKEDIMKQWVAEGFIHAPTWKDSMKVAGSYFDMLVNMGLIQQIDVDYGDEVLYYAVHHLVHDFITSKSIDEDFITVMDCSQRTMRFSNKVSRLSLQFGNTTHATSPESTTTGLSQVRLLAFFGLMSCQPSIFGFKLLRSLILHIWADQPSTGVDLKCTSELVLLRSLQVTSNGTVHLPDLIHLPDRIQGPEQLETLEINARVATIPATIVHLRSWFNLRLGVGTELPDLTGIMKNVTLNPPISLDESSSPPDSVKTFQLLHSISRMPKWIGQLTNLCTLKFVVRELQSDDITNLQRLPALAILSLCVQRRITEAVSFATGEFATLQYFEFSCGVLRLKFQEGTMPNLLRLKLCFNAHIGEHYGGWLVGVEHMLNLQKISVLIGPTAGAGECDMKDAESAVKKAMGKHHSNVSLKRADMIEEEFDAPEIHHSIGGKHPSTSSEQPGSGKQESQENIEQKADANSQLVIRSTNKKEHANVEPRTDPPEIRHVIQGKHPSTSCEQPATGKQESQENLKKKADTNSQSIKMSSNKKEHASVEPSTDPRSGQEKKRKNEVNDLEAAKQNLSPNELGNDDAFVKRKYPMEYLSEKMSSSDPQPFKMYLLKAITEEFSENKKIGSGGYGAVYKGVLNGDEIAVKKLFPVAGLNDEAFDKEFRNIKKVRHKNVIRMIGYCYEIAHRDVEYKGQLVWSQVIDRALCFEYMKGGSLANHISDESCIHDWSTTYRIITGTCEGLHYLHHGGEKKIFHLDLKPDNVLLDENLVPKITDFGLSRLFGTSYTHQMSSMKGSIGFMPKEYIHNQKVSPKNDVFSLGVIIFHMMVGAKGYGDYWDTCHRQNFSPKIQQEFIDSVQEYWKTKMHASEIYRWDKTDMLGVTKCIEIAMRCVEDDRDKRPSIKEIMGELNELDSKMEEILKEDPKPLIRQLKRKNQLNDLEAEKQNISCSELGKDIEVDPSLELRFPFEPNKEISCCMQLTNRATTSSIAFSISTSVNKYHAQPNRGILAPCSKCYITLTLRAQEAGPPNMQCADVLVVQGVRVSEQFTTEEITQDLFGKASVVDEVILPIVYIPMDIQGRASVDNRPMSLT